MILARLAAGFLLAGCVACDRAGDAPVDSSAPAASSAAPHDSLIPEGPLGVSIRRGRGILAATRDSLPGHVGNQLRCVSCHFDNGTRANVMPWIGVYGQFPQYRARAGAIQVVQDRINDCFERSMNGRALPEQSREMRDIIAYLAFLSLGVPGGAKVPGQGLPPLKPVPGDTVRGAAVFAQSCARCHGQSGEGGVAPPVWGNGSYNIGAGMSRVRTAAAFIRVAMPFDRPGTLTEQQAFDVATYINSRPRPDFPGKEKDWPRGDPPPDVAYPTSAAAARKP
ncbi:MAG TPA: c-type cytochrome [Gemmatimonadaceae bacterium]|nr:c-type cytochrome [Gemmatimonadaceae bacterium]